MGACGGRAGRIDRACGGWWDVSRDDPPSKEVTTQFSDAAIAPRNSRSSNACTINAKK
jgi:hypothetical protein